MGGTATPAQALAVERASMLLALAEDSRARRLAGDTAVTLDDIIRLDGAIRRALRDWGPSRRDVRVPSWSAYRKSANERPCDMPLH